MTETLIAIVFLLLGVVAGWFLWGRRREAVSAPPAATAVPVAGTAPEPVAAQPERVAVADEPVGDEPVAEAPADAEPVVTEPEPVAEDPVAVEPVVAVDEPVVAVEPEPVVTPEPEPVADAVPVVVPEPEPAAEPEPAVAPEPEPVAEPVAAAPDDLKRIEGIGPRMEAALHTAGITTFEALAGAAEADLRAAIAAAGLRLSPTLPTWAQQARLLADGDEAGFRELIGRIGSRARAAKG